MRDKLLRAKLYNSWMVMTCRRRKCVKFVEFEKLVQETALNTFLKTSLNTELVITILKGITILAASSSDKIDHMGDADMYLIKQTTTIVLSEVKISNAKDFTLTSSGRSTKVKSTNQTNSDRSKSEKRRILESESEVEEESDADQQQ